MRYSGAIKDHFLYEKTRVTLMNQFLTVEQLAEFLNCKESTIYSWVSKGAVPCYKIGRLVRFRLEDIEEWLRTQRGKASESSKKTREYSSNTGTCTAEDVIRKAIDEVKGNAL